MELQKNGNGTILEKGIDTIRDPNSGKTAKIAAFGMVAVGAIAFLGKAVIDAMNNSKT